MDHTPNTECAPEDEGYEPAGQAGRHLVGWPVEGYANHGNQRRPQQSEEEMQRWIA